MGEVVFPAFETSIDTDPARILHEALSANLKQVVVLGYDQEGEEFALSSIASGATVVWLLERTKQRLLSVPDVLGD